MLSLLCIMISRSFIEYRDVSWFQSYLATWYHRICEDRSTRLSHIHIQYSVSICRLSPVVACRRTSGVKVMQHGTSQSEQQRLGRSTWIGTSPVTMIIS
jgi:hypothetical protein